MRTTSAHSLHAPPFRFIQAFVWKVCVLSGGACPYCAMRRRPLALLRQDSGRSPAARPPLGSSPPNRSRAGRRGRGRAHTRGQRLPRGMVRTPRWMPHGTWGFSASCGQRASSLSGPSEALLVWAWRVILPFPPHRFAAWSPLPTPGGPRCDLGLLRRRDLDPEPLFPEGDLHNQRPAFGAPHDTVPPGSGP